MRRAMIGVGRMGASLVRRLVRDGHECVVYDTRPETVQQLASGGAEPASSPADLVRQPSGPRAVWVTVPAATTGPTIDDLAPLLDVQAIDGGNSCYRHGHRGGRRPTRRSGPVTLAGRAPPRPSTTRPGRPDQLGRPRSDGDRARAPPRVRAHSRSS